GGAAGGGTGGASAVLAVDPDPRQRRTVLVGQRLRAVHVQAEVVHAAVAQGVYPAVHVHLLPARPGVAHDRGLAHVGHLLEHVQFAQAVVPQAVFLDPGQQRFVSVGHVLDVPDPVVGQAHPLAVERGEHAAAAVVADHQDVLDP